MKGDGADGGIEFGIKIGEVLDELELEKLEELGELGGLREMGEELGSVVG